MASINRSAVITKLYKVLKRHFQPAPPPPARTLFENLLFAACLENAPYAAAEAAFQAVSTALFDWNEVRVSTVKELSEIMKAHPDAASAANRLRRSLQALFEANYSFDLEPMKKLNLGQAVQKLSSYDGVTPFAVGYVTQFSLGGHSIPLDSGAMGALAVIGLVEEKHTAKDGCPGLERAIPKNKGIEFGSLLHLLAVEFHANPYSTNLHKILLEVDPEAKGRLPKRQAKVEKKPEPAPAPAPAPAAKGGKVEAKPDAKSAKPEVKGKPTDDKKAADKKADAKKAEEKKPGEKKPEKTDGAKKPEAPAAKKPASVAAPAAKKPTAKPAAKPTIAKRKPR
jgi:endonuclease-3